MFWKKVWLGLKIALGVAVKLNDLGVIKVKEVRPGEPGRVIVDEVTK